MSRTQHNIFASTVKAAREGSVPAICKLGDYMSKNKDTVLRLGPTLLDIISKDDPPDGPFDLENPRITEVLVTFQSLQHSQSLVSKINGMPESLVSMLLARWKEVTTWINFIADQSVVQAYATYGEELEGIDSVQYQVFHIIVPVINLYHGAALPRPHSPVYSTPNFLHTLYRIWMAIHSSLPAGQPMNPSMMHAFIHANCVVGQVLVNPEATRTAYTQSLDRAHLPVLTAKACQLLLLHPGIPDFQVVDALMGMLFTHANPFEYPGWYPISLRDEFVGIAMRLARRILLQIPLKHHESRHSADSKFIACAMSKIGQVFMGLLCSVTNRVQIALLTHALREGLLPITRRIWYMGSCPCRCEHCPWSNPYCDNPHSGSWATIFHLVGLVGGESYDRAFEKSARQMRRDVIRGGQTELKASPPPEWTHAVEYRMPLIIRRRAEFKRSYSFCEGPDCNASCGQNFPQLKKCGGCDKVLYCSKRCQKLDWAGGHSLVCGTSDVIRFQMRYSPLLTNADEVFATWFEE